jgi:hypothetical protein
VQDDVEYPFEDADLDDGLDPAMQEELDREVEDFARRLNSVWPERMHLGQERRIESHMIGGNGSLQRFSGNYFYILKKFCIPQSKCQRI